MIYHELRGKLILIWFIFSCLSLTPSIAPPSNAICNSVTPSLCYILYYSVSLSTHPTSFHCSGCSFFYHLSFCPLPPFTMFPCLLLPPPNHYLMAFLVVVYSRSGVNHISRYFRIASCLLTYFNSAFHVSHFRLALVKTFDIYQEQLLNAKIVLLILRSGNSGKFYAFVVERFW